MGNTKSNTFNAEAVERARHAANIQRQRVELQQRLEDGDELTQEEINRLTYEELTDYFKKRNASLELRKQQIMDELRAADRELESIGARIK